MRPFVRPVPSTWWLKRRVYFLFILRELTSVFIAVYLILFLNLLYQLSLGRQAYEIYLDFLATPGMIVFPVLALVAPLYYSITCFWLLPDIILWRISRHLVYIMLRMGAPYAPW